MSVLLYLFAALWSSLHSQSPVRIHRSTFNNSNEWTVIDEGNGIEWEDNKKCVHQCVSLQADAEIEQTFTTIGYHTINITLYVRSFSVEDGEKCFMTVFGGSSQVNFILVEGDSEKETFQYFGVSNQLPDTDDYTDQTNLKIRLGTIGDNLGGGAPIRDSCSFGNLQVWGIPYNTSVTNSSNDGKSEGNSTGIIIGTIAALFCILICCIVYFVYKKAKKTDKKDIDTMQTQQARNNNSDDKKENKEPIAIEIVDGQKSSQFEGNLDNLQAADNMLMDDVVDEMDNGDMNHGQNTAGNVTAGAPNVDNIDASNVEHGEKEGYEEGMAMEVGESLYDNGGLETAGGDADDDGDEYVPPPSPPKVPIVDDNE